MYITLIINISVAAVVQMRRKVTLGGVSFVRVGMEKYF